MMQFKGKVASAWLVPLVFIIAGTRARADQNYSDQVFFENSLSPENYFYSSGKVSPPSTLELINGKLPVERDTFISGPNALKLQWESAADGGWSAEVKLYEWRNRTRLFPGTKLFLWLYAARGIRAADLPRLALRDAEGDFSQLLELGVYTQDIKPASWTRVGIPLASFQTASVKPFQSHRVSTLIFVQGKSDAVQHTLLLDDIRVENDAPSHHPPPSAPAHVQAKGYERHIDITWSPVEDPALAQYV